LFNAALSDRGASAVMSNRPLSPTNKILEGPSKPVREIEVQTLIGDEALSNLGLGTLSNLKIDTEGHEISVLDEFHNALSNGLMSFLQVETRLNPQNIWNVPFEEIKRRLEDYNYRLFSMINLV